MDNNFDRDIGPYEGSREEELKAEELTQAKLSDVDVFREFIQEYLGYADSSMIQDMLAILADRTVGNALSLHNILVDMFETFCEARAWEDVKEMDDLKPETEY